MSSRSLYDPGQTLGRPMLDQKQQMQNGNVEPAKPKKKDNTILVVLLILLVVAVVAGLIGYLIIYFKYLNIP
jgi:heme/copper-type cytochrome/quinol oxidase subunit 2